MRPLLASIACTLALAACNTTTTTVTQRPDGKTVTVITEKKTSDGVLTAFFNSLLGGFVTVFSNDKQP